MEDAALVWNCLSKKYVKKVEKVQRRATKMIPQLRNLNYEERLLNLDLTSLEERRRRGDMIQMYKVHKKVNIVSLKMTIPNKENKLNPNEEIKGHATSVMERRRSGIRLVKEYVWSGSHYSQIE